MADELVELDEYHYKKTHGLRSCPKLQQFTFMGENDDDTYTRRLLCYSRIFLHTLRKSAKYFSQDTVLHSAI
jgi:hypothetical protein